MLIALQNPCKRLGTDYLEATEWHNNHGTSNLATLSHNVNHGRRCRRSAAGGLEPGRAGGHAAVAPPPCRTRSLARDACMLARLGYHYHLAHHLPAIEAASRPHLTLTVSLHWGGGAGRGPRGVRTTVNIMETNLSPAFGRGCSIL